MELFSLPALAFNRVAGFLSIRDALALGHASKHMHADASHIWQGKFDSLPEQFRVPDAGNLETRVKDFMKWSRRAYGIGVDQMGGAWWENSSYWRAPVVGTSTLFGTAAVLQNVCWLDFGGHGICGRGEYSLMLRIRLTRFAGSEWRRELSVPAADGVNVDLPADAVELAAPAAVVDTRTLPQSVWLWLNLGRVRVDAPRADIHFRVFDHSPPWKSGLTIDHARFVPIAEVERVTGVAAAAWSSTTAVACSSGAPIAAPPDREGLGMVARIAAGAQAAGAVVGGMVNGVYNAVRGEAAAAGAGSGDRSHHGMLGRGLRPGNIRGAPAAAAGACAGAANNTTASNAAADDDADRDPDPDSADDEEMDGGR